MRGLAVALLLILAGPVSSFAQPPDVERVLKEYYEGREKDPPFEAEIANLGASDAKKSDAAAAWLLATLAKAHSDETSGKAPWRATPFWGRGPENPARNLRTTILEKLESAEKVPAAAVPVLRWYLEKETLFNLQLEAARALTKVEGAEGVKLRREVIEKPHENCAVVVVALVKAKASKELIADERLLPLCHHHRASVREAARELRKVLGGAELEPFDAVAAMKTPAIVKLLQELDSLLMEKPAADAEWIVATYKVRDDRQVEREFTRKGWLLRNREKTLEILTPFGWRESVRESKEPTRDNDDENLWTCSVARGKIEEEVNRVEAIRKEGAKDFEFSERGGLTGQFKGNGAGLYELILASRLHAAGKNELAARVLFPALDTLYRDDGAIDIVRRELGQNYGYAMLVAFVGDRDYPRAELLAKTIAERYPQTIFHSYAVRLAKELPQRRDDFVTFKLPTHAAWEEMKKKMSRAEQIDFLAQRYRLLNYFQAGQPGGYMPGDKQYAEPCGMTRNAAWGLQRGKTEVINPETELAGVVGWSNKGDKNPVGMDLKIADIPLLSKHLQEDWAMPTVSFWRDFAAERDLSTTRPYFIGIINGLAKRDICQTEGWGNLAPEEISKQIDRINRWAADNANKTDQQLHWESLQDLVAAGKGWNAAGHHIATLLSLKDDRAYDVLRNMLDHKDADPHRILELYLAHDPTRAKDLAPRYLKDPYPYARLVAAKIVYQTGDKAAARTTMGDFLAKYELDNKAKEVVELLLKEESKEGREEVKRLFKNKQVVEGRASFHDNTRGEIFRLCISAGILEPYSYYLRQLDNQEVAYTSFSSDDGETKTTYAQAHADEIVKIFAANDPFVLEIAKKHSSRDERIPHLKKWLQEKIGAK